jgi:hypothetical protein
MQRDFERLANLTLSSDPQVEHGGTIVSERDGRLRLINHVKGTPEGVHLNYSIGEGQILQGTFHTHTYSDLAFSATDIAAEINEGRRVAIAQTGTNQFTLLRTAKTPSEVNASSVLQDCTTQFVELQNSGMTTSQIMVKVSREMAARYHFAFYQGSQGVLRRQDPPA